MNLHKCIVHPGIRTSEKFGRLNFLQRDLFYGLLTAANTKGGWFENNAGALRAALFAPCLGKVSERDIKDGLLKLREVEMIKLWTGRNGRAYGAIINYRQRFDYGEALPTEAKPSPEDELFPDPGMADEAKAVPPPAPPLIHRIEVSEKRGRKAAGTHDTRLVEDCLSELQAHWPKHDLAACYRRAVRHVRKARGEDAVLTVGWFETHWMPKEGEAKAKPYTKAVYAGKSEEETAREAAQVRAEWRKQPEPPKGTLEHALWTEAHKS